MRNWIGGEIVIRTSALGRGRGEAEWNPCRESVCAFPSLISLKEGLRGRERREKETEKESEKIENECDRRRWKKTKEKEYLSDIQNRINKTTEEIMQLQALRVSASVSVRVKENGSLPFFVPKL